MNYSANPSIQDNDRYALGLAASGMHMAQYLYNEESNSQRKKKKGIIISKKRGFFVSALEAYAKEHGELKSAGTHTADVTNWIREWKLDDRLTLLIDTLYSNPFLPYDVEYRENDFKAAWEKLGKAIGVGTKALNEIESNASNAKKAHHHNSRSNRRRTGRIFAGCLSTRRETVSGRSDQTSS